MSGAVEEIRWIDPDRWGRFAWSFLFATTFELDRNPSKITDWHQFISTLPFALPCQSCKICCAKFIATSPLPTANININLNLNLTGKDNDNDNDNSSSTSSISNTKIKVGGACPLNKQGGDDTQNLNLNLDECSDHAILSLSNDTFESSLNSLNATTARMCQEWLCSLRRDIQKRNSEKQQNQSKTETKTKYKVIQTNQEIMAYYIKRFRFQSLWLLDTFIFLSTVILTADFLSISGLNHIRQFFEGVVLLSPIDLRLNTKDLNNLTNEKQFLQWLYSSKVCPAVSLIKSFLQLMPLNTKRMRLKNKSIKK
jgi:hypothetical protein